LHQLAFAGRAQTALAMSGGRRLRGDAMPLARSSRRKVSRLREKPSFFDQLLLEMMIV